MSTANPNRSETLSKNRKTYFFKTGTAILTYFFFHFITSPKFVHLFISDECKSNPLVIGSQLDFECTFNTHHALRTHLVEVDNVTVLDRNVCKFFIITIKCTCILLRLMLFLHVLLHLLVPFLKFKSDALCGCLCATDTYYIAMQGRSSVVNTG